MSDMPERHTIDDLLEIMARLRDPEKGCPWDVEQTFETIVPYTIEEAYEVAEAIEHKDMAALKDEIGDLLFQVVFYARMAEEAGAFDFSDITHAICHKMIRRHPHVFGDSEVRDQDRLRVQWDDIKSMEREEKKRNGHKNGQEVPSKSVLDDVPYALPALIRAIKLQNRAARVGFDWPDLKPVFAKLREELDELEYEIDNGRSKDLVAEEFGDTLFVLANIGRHLKVDPEDALRGANAKFVRRFTRIEHLLAERGSTPEQSNLEEMDALWDQAKREEKAPVQDS